MEPLLLDSIKTVKIMAEGIDEQEYSTKGDGAKYPLHHSSMRNFAQTFRGQGLAPKMLEPVITWVERTIEQGRGDDGFSSLIEVIWESSPRHGS